MLQNVYNKSIHICNFMFLEQIFVLPAAEKKLSPRYEGGRDIWGRIHNIPLSLYLTNGPNKLVGLSLANPFSFVFCNTLAYWAHS
jgi:hypothetical protein